MGTVPHSHTLGQNHFPIHTQLLTSRSSLTFLSPLRARPPPHPELFHMLILVGRSTKFASVQTCATASSLPQTVMTCTERLPEIGALIDTTASAMIITAGRAGSLPCTDQKSQTQNGRWKQFGT